LIDLPAGLTVDRNEAVEARLVAEARIYVEGGGTRPKGVHATDILDPLRAYWQTVDPRPLTDREVMLFFPGKMLHALVLGGESDEGARYSEELGLWWSPDKTEGGEIRELKTVRNFEEPKAVGDLRLHLEQLLVYMSASGTTAAQLWVLLLNLRDKQSSRTSPAFRVYDVSLPRAELDECRGVVAEYSRLLSCAIAQKSPAGLPLCREWKCGARNCEWYNTCQPAGRFGTSAFDRAPPIERIARDRAPIERDRRGGGSAG